MTDTGRIEKCIELADDTDMGDFDLKKRARSELAAIRDDNAAQARQIAALREALGKTLLDRNLRLVQLERLREIEWLQLDTEAEMPQCPICYVPWIEQHKPGCWLGKLIAGKETK